MELVQEWLSGPLVLSAVGTAGNLLAMKLLANGRQAGWYVSLFTLIPTAALASITGAYVNAVACIVYAAICVRAIQATRAGRTVQARAGTRCTRQPSTMRPIQPLTPRKSGPTICDRILSWIARSRVVRVCRGFSSPEGW